MSASRMILVQLRNGRHPRGSRRSWRPAGSAMRAARRARSHGCLGDWRRKSSRLASPPRMIAMGDVLSFAGEGFGSSPRRVQSTPGASRVYEGLSSFSKTTAYWALSNFGAFSYDRIRWALAVKVEPSFSTSSAISPTPSTLLPSRKAWRSSASIRLSSSTFMNHPPSSSVTGTARAFASFRSVSIPGLFF